MTKVFGYIHPEYAESYNQRMRYISFCDAMTKQYDGTHGLSNILAGISVLVWRDPGTAKMHKADVVQSIYTQAYGTGTVDATKITAIDQIFDHAIA
jgi:hypothetical protein